MVGLLFGKDQGSPMIAVVLPELQINQGFLYRRLFLSILEFINESLVVVSFEIKRSFIHAAIILSTSKIIPKGSNIKGNDNKAIIFIINCNINKLHRSFPLKLA
jgi:hypothetical protein